MFSFFLVSLFFGLLCRAGFPIIRHTLVKQQSNLKGFPQLTMRGHSDQKKNIPIQAKCELMGSLTVSKNLNK